MPHPFALLRSSKPVDYMEEDWDADVSMQHCQDWLSETRTTEEDLGFRLEMHK